MDVLLILLAFLLVIYFIVKFLYNETSYVKSKVDNNNYIIRRGNKNEVYLKDSADRLAEINLRIIKLIDHLDKKYQTDISKNYFIKYLKQNYKSDILSEAAFDNRYTTYTIDKQDMHVCLRTRDKNEDLYDINLLMYVILHELAHLCNYDRLGNPIIGHGIEFKNIFRFLIIESININIYKYTDYSETPHEYCGIMISTTILPKYEYDLIQTSE